MKFRISNIRNSRGRVIEDRSKELGKYKSESVGVQELRQEKSGSELIINISMEKGMGIIS
jgi:hypothetical protein